MDEVTALRETGRGFVAVFAGGETLRLSKADLRALPLAAGDQVDLADYRKRLLLRQYPEALNRAVGLLAMRARSKQEVERRLTERGYLPETVEMVLFKLERENLLGDEDFAKTWAESRATLGVGKMRLRQELRMKGVDGDVAEDVLATLDEEGMAQQALALAEKLLRRLKNEALPDARRKALAAMQRRGYGYGEASRAIQAALAQMEIDPDE
jgi:regulatory protein